MYIEPSTIVEVEKFKHVFDDRPLCPCEETRYVEVLLTLRDDHGREESSCVVACQNTALDYVADVYRLHTGQEAQVEVCLKPSNLTFRTGSLRFEEHHLHLTVTVKEWAPLQDWLLPEPFRPVRAYRHVKTAEDHALELIVCSPAKKGFYYVVGGSQGKVLLISRTRSEDICELSKTTADCLTRSDYLYCHRPFFLALE